MYKLMIETGFSSAHQLRGYKGKCENLHGHSWSVKVYVKTQYLNEIGLAIDFHDLKRMTNEIISVLDHTCINEVFPFTEINPSCENIAKWLFDSLMIKLKDVVIKVEYVTVFESPTSSATYSED